MIKLDERVRAPRRDGPPLIERMMDTQQYQQPLYCCDRPNIHTAAMPVLKARGFKFLPHPPMSPDFNKVVEHALGNLAGKLQRWLQANARNQHGAFPLDVCAHQLKHLFYSMQPENFQGDVHSLPALWDCVRKDKPEGVDGGWPPKHLR